MHVEVVQTQIPDEPGGRGGSEHRVALDQLAILPNRQDGVKHQAGLFLERHLGEQVVDPLLDRAVGIFVGIDPAVLVQVPG